MSFDEKIKIDKVWGGDPDDHDALKHNYFLATGVNKTYQLFEPNGNVVPTVPIVFAEGYDFSFKLKGMNDVEWWVTKFLIDEKRGTASGNWHNTHNPGDDEGQFQAAAGGTVVPEASSAKA